MSSTSAFRIAAICTCWFPVSHADVILSRWLTPRAGDAAWGWSGPRSRIVSVYLDQIAPNDMGRQTTQEHGIPLTQSVHEALTLGGDQLAVDGVILIGEHGDYPFNALGQKLYPRRELFDQVVATFQRCGRCVPVFSDKHLSWSFDSAQHMVQTAQRLGFTLFAGSSLPHCPTRPPLASLEGRKIEQVVSVFFGGTEAYGYHSIEFALSHIERRAGGESGIRQVTAFVGDEAVAEAQRQGWWDGELLNAALAHAKPARPDRQPECDKEAHAFVFDHEDGLRVTHLCLDRQVSSWLIAVRAQGDAQPSAGASLLGDAASHYAHFATLARVIEDGLISGKPGYPWQRVLLSTGAIEALMRSLAQPGRSLPTPQLKIAY